MKFSSETKLSKHFRLRELEKSQVALRNDIDNTVQDETIFNNLKYIRTISKDKLAKEESNDIFYKFSNYYYKAMVASYKSKFITEIITIFFIFLARKFSDF